MANKSHQQPQSLPNGGKTGKTPPATQKLATSRQRRRTATAVASRSKKTRRASPKKKTNNNQRVYLIIGGALIGAILVLLGWMIARMTPAPSVYPLTGQTYVAWINGSQDTSGLYTAVWEANGWLHQPRLPEEGHRVGFVMSITIEEGNYTFSGVSCRLHLDTTRNGQGANNPKTVGYGNRLPFTVDTADNGQVWAFIVCDPTDVTGFSIQYVGP